MPYAGQTIMGRQHVSLVAPHWPNEKVKATATAMAESALSIGAWHDNLAPITEIGRDAVVCNVETYEPVVVLDPDKGRVRLTSGEIVTVPTASDWIISRDCGLYQINIPAQQVGTLTESELRTDSRDESVFMKVAKQNVDAAYQKWTQPWVRDGKQDYRRWQPWVAYTTGWAMFPEAWVWKQTDGTPTGPWTATGRYLHKAIRAVANWHYVVAKDMDGPEATAEAERLAAHFGIDDGDLFWNDKSFVTWKYPAQPTAPPADGIGPRPVKNNGR